jgi:hypothetical protein
MKFLRLLLVAAVGVLAGVAQAQTVYVNDFESNTAGFTTSGRTNLPTTPNASSPLSSMLGKFANNEFSNLILSGLNPGETYNVAFDLFIGGSWDGNNTTYGQDCWILRENYSNQYMVNTTFSHLNDSGFTQNYSDTNPVGNLNGGGPYSAKTGADVISANPDSFAGYQIYYFGRGAGNPILTFTANGAGLASLTFQGVGLQNVDDEYWAIDNVRVTSARIPEPASAALGLLALPALALIRRKK